MHVHLLCVHATNEHLHRRVAVCSQPVYFALFGFHVFGLGFVTSMVRLSRLVCSCKARGFELLRTRCTSSNMRVQIFIFMTGVFVSSWMGTAALSLGEWIIKKLPLVKHVYSAAKQVTAGLNPENENAKSFRECVLIRHPRHGEYAFGFITGETILQVCGTTSRVDGSNQHIFVRSNDP